MKILPIIATVWLLLFNASIANATLIQTTWSGSVTDGLNDHPIGTLFTLTAVYDDAGTSSSVWNDGPNQIAERGEGDDTLEHTHTLPNFGLPSVYDFLSDAVFNFSLAPLHTPPFDVTDSSLSRIFGNSDGIGGQLQMDNAQMTFTMLASGSSSLIMNYRYANESGEQRLEGIISTGTLRFVSSVPVDASSVPIPSTAWLVGLALLGLVRIKHRKA